MTQMECEMALIKLGEAMREIVMLYDASINHFSVTANSDGYINVVGAEFDGAELIKNDLLDASKYGDGHIRFGGADDD